jgi:hypothetical protein
VNAAGFAVVDVLFWEKCKNGKRTFSRVAFISLSCVFIRNPRTIVVDPNFLFPFQRLADLCRGLLFWILGTNPAYFHFRGSTGQF